MLYATILVQFVFAFFYPLLVCLFFVVFQNSLFHIAK